MVSFEDEFGVHWIRVGGRSWVVCSTVGLWLLQGLGGALLGRTTGGGLAGIMAWVVHGSVAE